MTAVLAARAVAPGHLPGTAGYRRVVVALFAAGLATFANLYSTQAILPELAARFGTTAAASTLTVSLCTLGLGLALLVAGPLSDAVGRTRLVHASLAASAVVAAACALAPSWPALLALRLAEGVALAGLPAAATAYLREELHPSAQARAAGLYIGGTALGGMAGRLLTGAVAEAAGWRWALAAAAALGLACTLTVAALLPPSRRFAPARAALASAARAAADRRLLALYGIGATAAGALVAVFNVLGFRLAGAPFHLGPAAVSLLFLVYPLGSLSSAVAGRLADTHGRGAVLPLGTALAAAGVLVTLGGSLPFVIAGLALLTSGFFAVHGVASGWVPARAHVAGVPTGQAASLYLFAYYLGSSLFGSLAGRAWTTASWPGVASLAALLFAASGALAVVLRRPA